MALTPLGAHQGQALQLCSNATPSTHNIMPNTLRRLKVAIATLSGSGGSPWECSKMHRVVRSGGGSSPREHSILYGVDLYGARQQVQA